MESPDVGVVYHGHAIEWHQWHGNAWDERDERRTNGEKKNECNSQSVKPLELWNGPDPCSPVDMGDTRSISPCVDDEAGRQSVHVPACVSASEAIRDVPAALPMPCI